MQKSSSFVHIKIILFLKVVETIDMTNTQSFWFVKFYTFAEAPLLKNLRPNNLKLLVTKKTVELRHFFFFRKTIGNRNFKMRILNTFLFISWFPFLSYKIFTLALHIGSKFRFALFFCFLFNYTPPCDWAYFCIYFRCD